MGYSYFALLEHAVLLPGEAVQPVDDEGNIAHGQLRSLPGLVLEQQRKQLRRLDVAIAVRVEFSELALQARLPLFLRQRRQAAHGLRAPSADGGQSRAPAPARLGQRRPAAYRVSPSSRTQGWAQEV